MRQQNYTSSGMQKIQPAGYSFLTEDYDLFQVIYVCYGELVFSAEQEYSVLGPGGLAILRKGGAFELSCPRIGYRGVAFHAIGELPAAFAGQAESLQANAEIRTLAQLMEKQLASPGPEFALELDGLARALAWEAIGLSEKTRDILLGRTAMQWAQAAREAIEASLHTPAAVKEILESLPLSYRQISRYFTSELGQSPKAYQLEAKIREAKHLLSSTKLSITAIALELGFASSQHFATQFRHLTHMMPSTYRGST